MIEEFEYSPTWLYHPIVIDGVEYSYDPSAEVPVMPDHEDFGRTVQQIVGDDIITDDMIIEHRELDTWEQIRQHRNKLLIASDWVSGEDVPQAIKDVWFPYRQTLRDITSIENPDDVVWPTKPQ